MLTIGQHIVVEKLAEAILFAIRSAYATKQLKRISIRFENGIRVRREFSAPVNASGNLSRETRYEITDTQLIFYAPAYIYDSIYGKRPAQSASSIDHNLEHSIRKWIDYKGIVSDKFDSDQLAFLITKKIQAYGNSIWLYSKGQDSGLLNNILTPELISNYNTKFTRQLELEIKQL